MPQRHTTDDDLSPENMEELLGRVTRDMAKLRQIVASQNSGDPSEVCARLESVEREIHALRDIVTHPESGLLSKVTLLLNERHERVTVETWWTRKRDSFGKSLDLIAKAVGMISLVGAALAGLYHFLLYMRGP